MQPGGTPRHSAPRGPRPFLARLARDAGGNALAIVGAALIPLTAMIGGGVDISRAYMAKARLQSACDAASLAGRRVMTNDTFNQAVINESNKFFNFNYPQGLYGTNAFTPVVTKPSSGVIKVAATTTIPTGIMHLFGFATMNLAVECEAEQNFINTDVMLVLDVTGSMAESVDGGVKIVALREAVMALYDELAPIQTELEANNMRLRYGAVPYSSSVNVGGIVRAVNSDYISSNWTYQSRTAIYDTTTQETFANKTSTQCDAYRVARTPANSYPATEKTVYRPGSGTSRDCVVTTHNFTTAAVGTFSHWLHQPVVHNTSVYKTGASVPVPTRLPGTTQNATWAGCIEERETVDTITSSSGYNIPSGANDLDLDLIPTTEDTRWRPLWPEVSYIRSGTAGQDRTTAESDVWSLNAYAAQGYVACPAAAVRLTNWTRGNMQTYVNSLLPIGGTYHDIGMIWGGRMISDQGIFGADNPTTWNSMPVNKHIIFMTDGQLAPNNTVYSSYGVEYLDQRVTGSPSAANQYSKHEQRFKMMCNAIKGKNVSIWVISFDTALSAALTECASNASQTSVSSSKAQLIAKFREIGKNIGALRLTK